MRTRHVIPLLAAGLVLTACSSGPPSPVGIWSAGDGTGIKQIGDNGLCTDMYYTAQGETLDIGGPMTCSFGSEKDANDRYLLVVKQSMNTAQFRVAFDGDSTMTLYNGGTQIAVLSKQ